MTDRKGSHLDVTIALLEVMQALVAELTATGHLDRARFNKRLLEARSKHVDLTALYHDAISSFIEVTPPRDEESTE